MKKIISLLLTMLILGTSVAFSITAQESRDTTETQQDDQTEPDNIIWSFDADSGTLTLSGEGKMPDYATGIDSNVPWSPATNPEWYGNIVKVVVGEGITTIGDSAFSGCKNMTEIQLPSTLTYIGKDSLANCGSLTKITIPEKVTDIAMSAFGYDDRRTPLTEVTFLGAPPANDYSDMFCGFTGTVYIPTLDTDWTAADINNFRRAENSDITWLSADEPTCEVVPYGGMLCIYNAETKTVYVRGEGDMTDVLAGGMFIRVWMRETKHVVIEEGVTSVSSFAFYGCTELETVTLPASLHTLRDDSFYDNSVKTLDIPAGVRKIGLVYFGEELTDEESAHRLVRFYGNAPEISEDGLFFGFEGTAYYPAGNPTWTDEVRQAYSTAEGSNITWEPWIAPEMTRFTEVTGNIVWEYRTEDNTLYVSGKGDMSDFQELSPMDYIKDEVKHIVVEEGITGIGKNCFKLFGYAETLTLPQSLHTIADYAFSGCGYIRQVDVPAGVRSIGDWCLFLSELRFYGNIPAMHRSVFSGFKGDVYYPSGNPTWTQEAIVRYDDPDRNTINWEPWDAPALDKVNHIFRDVMSGQWYVGAVQTVYDKGIMNGTSFITFEPASLMTREQMIQIIFNMEQADKDGYTGGTGFADVPADQWYSAAVCWAKQVGITTGTGGGMFGLGNTMTREEMVTLLANYAKFLGIYVKGRPLPAVYRDADAISDWALGSVEWAVDNGIVTGKSGVTLAPADTATRAELSQVVMNMREYFRLSTGVDMEDRVK